MGQFEERFDRLAGLVAGASGAMLFRYYMLPDDLRAADGWADAGQIGSRGVRSYSGLIGLDAAANQAVFTQYVTPGRDFGEALFIAAHHHLMSRPFARFARDGGGQGVFDERFERLPPKKRIRALQGMSEHYYAEGGPLTGEAGYYERFIPDVARDVPLRGDEALGQLSLADHVEGALAAAEGELFADPVVVRFLAEMWREARILGEVPSPRDPLRLQTSQAIAHAMELIGGQLEDGEADEKTPRELGRELRLVRALIRRHMTEPPLVNAHRFPEKFPQEGNRSVIACARQVGIYVEGILEPRRVAAPKGARPEYVVEALERLAERMEGFDDLGEMRLALGTSLSNASMEAWMQHVRPLEQAMALVDAIERAGVETVAGQVLRDVHGLLEHAQGLRPSARQEGLRVQATARYA